MNDWTIDAIEQRLIEAARTIEKLPGGNPTVLYKLKAAWPDYVQDRQLAYGYNAIRKPKVQPAADEIDRMDECLDWVGDALPMQINGFDSTLTFPPDAARIVWLRAANVSWSKIQYLRAKSWGVKAKAGGKSPMPGGNSPVSLRKIYGQALEKILFSVVAKGVRFKPVPGTYAPRTEREKADYRGPRASVQLNTQDEYGTVTARATLVRSR